MKVVQLKKKKTAEDVMEVMEHLKTDIDNQAVQAIAVVTIFEDGAIATNYAYGNGGESYDFTKLIYGLEKIKSRIIES